jgi:hypothetical protein
LKGQRLISANGTRTDLQAYKADGTGMAKRLIAADGTRQQQQACGLTNSLLDQTPDQQNDQQTKSCSWYYCRTELQAASG